jgi:hypothetical protein
LPQLTHLYLFADIRVKQHQCDTHYWDDMLPLARNMKVLCLSHQYFWCFRDIVASLEAQWHARI